MSINKEANMAIEDKLNKLLSTGKRLRVFKTTDGSIGVEFENCDISDGCILRGEAGYGCNLDTAINDYCNKISGQKLVFNAMSSSRHEMMVII